MKAKIFKLIFLFSLSSNTFADDDNVLNGAIFGGQEGVCATIAKITGLSSEKIEELKKQLIK